MRKNTRIWRWVLIALLLVHGQSLAEPLAFPGADSANPTNSHTLLNEDFSGLKPGMFSAGVMGAHVEYQPLRNPQYNSSNYQATVSLPGWSGELSNGSINSDNLIRIK